MRKALWPTVSAWLVAACVAAGCGGKHEAATKSVSDPPTVDLIKPAVHNIVRVVGQPSFVDAYEQTPIYPKMTAYIEKWVVDIGDRVKKGDVLATLFVPELRQSYQTKKADVQVAKARIDLSLKKVDVAAAQVKASTARVVEARASLGKYKAEVDRWDTEVKRLQGEVARNVVAPQILLESVKQQKSQIALYDAQVASVDAAVADDLARQADWEEAKVDVTLARANLLVAESEEKRLEAWVGYLTLTAPYDGVIVARNANTGDFVLPASGDPSADRYAPDVSPAKAAPIFVVARTDVVRVFVDIPERDANFVQVGTKASVLVRAFRDRPIPGKVTRTSWALNVKSRTLRAEIDLHNTDAEILPGMYAYGKVVIEHDGVRALPLNALTYSGDQTFCWRYENEKAVRTEIQTGISDGDWIEVTNRRVASAQADQTDDGWVPMDGSEEVILGDLSILTDGAVVRVDATPSAPKVARAAPPATPRPGAIGQSGNARVP
ncbi:MAG: efflux RND transporter periplasmic adaptor subunit [Isosphaeraceae bacterium]|nr:efflux RND transporter periplasmic adaptor subunit [Isosphaeraceae bacterium]